MLVCFMDWQRPEQHSKVAIKVADTMVAGVIAEPVATPRTACAGRPQPLTQPSTKAIVRKPLLTAIHISELKSERELHRSRPTHLIQSAQRTKTLVECLCRLAKGCVTQVVIDSPEVRMIENIESLSAELQS
jgi:hypothetical protein